MPANRRVNGPHWNPKPDFVRSDAPGHTAAAVDYNNPEEIAHCLMDNDPSFSVYELFADVDMYPEAVHAAHEILRNREITYKLHIRDLNEAKVRENAAKQAEIRRQTRYIGRVIDIRSGLETVVESSTALPARSFA